MTSPYDRLRAVAPLTLTSTDLADGAPPRPEHRAVMSGLDQAATVRRSWRGAARRPPRAAS